MIKKYNQFVKKRINEEVEVESDLEIPTYNTTTKPDVKPDVRPTTKPRPSAPPLIPDRQDSPVPAPAKASLEEGEEEGGDLYDRKLKEMADALGSEVIDKTIEWGGHKITFPSETEKYHISGVKKNFSTVEEVLAELEKHDHGHNNKTPDIDEDEYHKGDLAFESKSYRTSRSRNIRRK